MNRAPTNAIIFIARLFQSFRGIAPIDAVARNRNEECVRGRGWKFVDEESLRGGRESRGGLSVRYACNTMTEAEPYVSCLISRVYLFTMDDIDQGLARL